MHAKYIKPSNLKNKKGRVKVIGIIENQVITKNLVANTKDKDILPIAVVERHKKTRRIGKGYVKGFGLKKGALASTVAHDSHNIIVVGKDFESMATAVNYLIKTGGGLVVVDKNKVIASLPLPIAGLMSNNKPTKVVKNLERINKASKKLGCRLSAPFMTLSFLALPVIPELKLTDKGLVDVKKFKFVDIGGV